MQVRVLYFGILKELLKRDGEQIELPAPASVATLLEIVGNARPQQDELWKSLAVAVNLEYVGMDQALHEGDEVALLPPVSGGSGPDLTGVRKVGMAKTVRTRSESFDSAPRGKGGRCSSRDDASIGDVIGHRQNGGGDED